MTLRDCVLALVFLQGRSEGPQQQHQQQEQQCDYAATGGVRPLLRLCDLAFRASQASLAARIPTKPRPTANHPPHTHTHAVASNAQFNKEAHGATHRVVGNFSLDLRCCPLPSSMHHTHTHTSTRSSVSNLSAYLTFFSSPCTLLQRVLLSLG